MRGVWARVSQFRNAIRGAIAAVVILAIVLVVVASHGGAQLRQSDRRTAQATSGATSAPASTDTPAPTNTPPPTPTATHPPAPTPTATAKLISGKIVRVVNSVPWLTGSVSVSCPSGPTLVGGGVDNGYGTSGYAEVQSSYPSSTHTWKVFGPASNVSYTLSAVADCLQSTTPVTIRIVTLTSPTSSYIISGVGAVSIYLRRALSERRGNRRRV